MPRFHFHTVDGKRLYDEDGCILANLQEARIEAVRLAGAMLRHEPEQLWKSGSWRVEVTNDAGRLLFTFTSMAVDAPPTSKPCWLETRP